MNSIFSYSYSTQWPNTIFPALLILSINSYHFVLFTLHQCDDENGFSVKSRQWRQWRTWVYLKFLFCVCCWYHKQQIWDRGFFTINEQTVKLLKNVSSGLLTISRRIDSSRLNQSTSRCIWNWFWNQTILLSSVKPISM